MEPWALILGGLAIAVAYCAGHVRGEKTYRELYGDPNNKRWSDELAAEQQAHAKTRQRLAAEFERAAKLRELLGPAEVR